MADHESYSKMDEEPDGDEPESSEAEGAFESLNIRKAEGGFIASCSRRPQSTDGGNGVMWSSPTDHVFDSKKKLLAYISKELGE